MSYWFIYQRRFISILGLLVLNKGINPINESSTHDQIITPICLYVLSSTGDIKIVLDIIGTKISLF